MMIVKMVTGLLLFAAHLDYVVVWHNLQLQSPPAPLRLPIGFRLPSLLLNIPPLFSVLPQSLLVLLFAHSRVDVGFHFHHSPLHFVPLPPLLPLLLLAVHLPLVVKMWRRRNLLLEKLLKKPR